MNEKVSATQVLTGLLADGDELQRCLSAQALGHIGEIAALQPLIARLRDEDEDVRMDAVEALGRLGDTRAEVVLCGHFAGADSGEERVAVLEALGRLGGARARDLLLNVATGRDEGWDGFQEDGWDSYWDAQFVCVEALGRLGDRRAVPVINELLKDESGQELSGAALKALSRLGEPGLEALIALLGHAATPVRRKAAALLASRGGAETREALVAALVDGDAGVRAAALAALSQAAAPLPWETAAPLLADGSALVRGEAVRFLPRSTGRVPEQAWAPLLNDPEPEVRREVVAALSVLAGPGAMPHLLAAADDPDQEVVCAAIGGLRETVSPEGWRVLRALPRDKARPGAVRVWAAWALSQDSHPQSRSALLELLGDSDQAVRFAALEGLTNLAWDGALEFLTSVVRGEVVSAPPDGETASSATMEEKTGVEEKPAEHARHPEHSTLAAILFEARARARPEDDPTAAPLNGEESHFLALAEERIRTNQALLRPRRAPPHLDIRVQAARLLGERAAAKTAHPPGGRALLDAREALVEALDEPYPALRSQAAEALGRIGEESAVGPLLAVAHSPGREVRLAVVRALAAIGGTEAARALPGLWPEPDDLVRRELVLALGAPDALEAVPLLREALEDRDSEIVKEAAAALLRQRELSAVPAILAAMGRAPGYNWRGIGAELAAAAPEEGFRLLNAALADPARAAGHGMAIGLLEEMALYGSR